VFHKASVKLAGLYLAVIMLISIFFSVTIYQLSVQEFDRGIRGGPTPDLRITNSDMTQAPSDFRELLIRDRENRYEEARDRVMQRLVFINLLILVGGGFLSYYLALRTLKPIEEAHEAQSRFTADASHELRTPITAMRTENEVALLNPKLTLAQAKKQLQSNIEELEKITNLTAGLLRLASLDGDRLEKTELQPTELLDKAVSRVVASAEQKHMLVNVVIDTNQTIAADEASLVEALVILLDNAVKYSPEKTEIVARVSKNARQITFEVIDKGMGIKATEMQHIFDRFYRADTARSKQNTEGYGLGLAIAKNIAELHGGSLQVTSKPNKGSTFTLSLPI
jgi:two-component system, OmpR family, sensor histidine kinase CiaH